MTTACPPAEQLLEFAAGALSDAVQSSIENHIDTCDACRGSLSSLAKQDATPAKTFGRYELETVLGQGGMGIVYRAWDPQLARPVAIKVVRAQAGHVDALRVRLVREAQSLAKLSHPNVCHVYDVDTEGDEVWVAMELIEGTTLRQWAQGRPRDELLEVLLGAAEGIAAAHASGLIHRDIKPENVLVTRDRRPVVTDFGLARVDLPVDPNASTQTGDPLLTQTGAIVGTPAYLAPEQLTGDVLDARVDQFAWATMAWELLTAVRPFPIIAAIRLDAIRAGLTPPASLPRPLANALIRALSLAPRDRFPSMRALIDVLRTPPARHRTRVPLVVGGAAMLAVGATLVTWQLLRSGDSSVSASTLPATPDAAIAVVEPRAADAAPAPAPLDAAIVAAPDAAPKPRAAPKHAVTTAPPAHTTQPPLRPLNNPSYSVKRAYATMMAFCKLPIDAARPDPKLGTHGVVDWGKVTRRETVIATLVDRERYMEMYEVRGQRGAYRFDGGSIAAGALGKLDVPVGQLVALCVDPNRPEKSTIYKLPAPWDGGQDLLQSVIPLSAPPRLGKLAAFSPLHVDEFKLSNSGDKGKLLLPPAPHYLVRAKVEARDGARWDMGKWWLETEGAKGADLVREGKLVWLVIRPPVFEAGVEGEKPRLVAHAAMILDEIFPH